jgi:hypothetical protein
MPSFRSIKTSATTSVKTALPQLGKAPGALCTLPELKERLLQWLRPFAAKSPTICYDFNGDWQLLCFALDYEVPAWLGKKNVYPHLDPVKLQMFFIDHGLKDHHALNDAKANRHAYDALKADMALKFRKAR